MRSKIISGIASMLLVACMLSIILFSFSLGIPPLEEYPIPYIPDPSQVDLRKENGMWFINVTVTFPKLNYIVSTWGTLEVWNNETWANAEFWDPGYGPDVLTDVWHTYSLAKLQPGEYTFTFKVWDTPVKDITFTHTYKPVDINGDGIVDIFELALVCKAYGSVVGEPEYNPDADFNQDGLVDMRDVVYVCRHWGT